MASIADPLLRWYDANRRDLPWRRRSDAYGVWVSEAMLQQTQVATVVPYYDRWMASLPTVEALAGAEPEEVLALWQGLGYYRRARNLQEGARWVVAHGWPGSAAEWVRVPGVGPYTAAAIASIAGGEAAALVDGNVERVYSRLTGDRSVGPDLRSAAWAWARRKVPTHRPGDYNQALMELGATICTPRKPTCGACPLREMCVALQTWQVDRLPTPKPRRETVDLRRVAWAPYREGAFGLVQVGEGEWWANLWAFPQADSELEGAEDSLRAIVGPGWAESLGRLRHQITHHRIRMDAYLVRAETLGHGLRWTAWQEMDALPMPAPHRKLLAKALETLGLTKSTP